MTEKAVAQVAGEANHLILCALTWKSSLPGEHLYSVV